MHSIKNENKKKKKKEQNPKFLTDFRRMQKKL